MSSKVGLNDEYRHRGIPSHVTRVHASSLHKLDPIEGWIPVDPIPDMLPFSASLERWQGGHVFSRRTPDD